MSFRPKAENFCFFLLEFFQKCKKIPEAKSIRFYQMEYGYNNFRKCCLYENLFSSKQRISHFITCENLLQAIRSPCDRLSGSQKGPVKRGVHNQGPSRQSLFQMRVQRPHISGLQVQAERRRRLRFRHLLHLQRNRSSGKIVSR